MKKSIRNMYNQVGPSQCEAAFRGLRCEQDKKTHVQHFGILKHNFKGVYWTDAGVKEKYNEDNIR